MTLAEAAWSAQRSYETGRQARKAIADDLLTHVRDASVHSANGVGPKGEKGDQGDPGPPGDPGEEGLEGLSAYAVAVVNGFTGDEPAWLASLVGAAGADGSDGAAGSDGADGAPGADGLQGVKGDKGDKGDPGDDGADGSPGTPGADGADGADGAPGADGATAAEVAALIYPVGAIYISTLSTNPATLLGFGTWAAWGAGRVIVGRDGNDTDFDTAEETGGAKTHTLQSSEMPSHTHVQNSHVHAMQRFPTATGGSTGFTVDTSMSGTVAAANDTAAATPTNQNTGGGGAHNNLQPYIVAYMWKRTA